MAKSKLALGLDIGSSSVKLVQLKDAKRGFILEAFGVAPLPPEAIVDGALMNSTAIVEAIRQLTTQYKLKNREAAIGVSGHSVIIKKISIPKNETIVLVNAGASVVNINVLANGLTTFTRDVTMGGNQFTEEIQKQLNVSYDEAEKLKVGGDTQADSDSVVPQEVERVIQGVADQMAGEIQRSLDFYTATAADSHIARLYLSGGTAKIPALFKVIEQRVGVPVEILNPFKGVEIDNRRFDPNYVLDLAPSAAVAIGLPMRKSNERDGGAHDQDQPPA